MLDPMSSSEHPPIASIAIKITAADGRELVLEYDTAPPIQVRVARGEIALVDGGARETLLDGVRRALEVDAFARR
jgi:hypothetical protein